MTTQKAKEIASQLYEYTGADFSQDTVKFKFCRDVQRILQQLHREGIIVTQDALQYGNTSAIFCGVTFEDVEQIPTYLFQRVVRY
jgi:hypothetical protein